MQEYLEDVERANHACMATKMDRLLVDRERMYGKMLENQELIASVKKEVAQLGVQLTATARPNLSPSSSPSPPFTSSSAVAARDALGPEAQQRISSLEAACISLEAELEESRRDLSRQAAAADLAARDKETALKEVQQQRASPTSMVVCEPRA